MDQQWLRSSYTYLASMVLIVCWVVSRPHTRTIILGDSYSMSMGRERWKIIVQCQWEERDAGNEIDTLYVWRWEGGWGGHEEWWRQCGRCSVLSVLLKVPDSLGPLVPLHRKSITVFWENAFNKASVQLKLPPTEFTQ